MEIKAKLSNFRTAPRKARQVVDLVRGKKVLEAQSILLFTVNKSARLVLKLVNSAVASAKHDFHLEESNLYISKITVDEGPKLKRWHPMSRGRAYPIIKRSANIALILSEIKPTIKEEKIEKKSEKEVEITKREKSKVKSTVKKSSAAPKTKVAKAKK